MTINHPDSDAASRPGSSGVPASMLGPTGFNPFDDSMTPNIKPGYDYEGITEPSEASETPGDDGDRDGDND